MSDLEINKIDKQAVLPCPFCGIIPKHFGRGVRSGVVVEQVIHPIVNNPRCPLNTLVFTVDSWNMRTI